jgi:hypothetical protein
MKGAGNKCGFATSSKSKLIQSLTVYHSEVEDFSPELDQISDTSVE